MQGTKRAVHRLLSSIGQCQAERGRQRASNNSGQVRQLAEPDSEHPIIQEYTTVGFNSTQKLLESQAKIVQPQGDGGDGKRQEASKERLHSVIAFCGGRPGILFAHLPSSVRLASLPAVPVKLIALPVDYEGDVASALGIRRVSMLGLLRGAPNAEKLFDVIDQDVENVSVPWLDEALSATHKPVQIRAIETTVSQPPRETEGRPAQAR